MSAPHQITVLAHWRAPPASVDELLSIVSQLRAKSLGEQGCLGYEVYRSADAPDNILLVERYRDEAALEAHKQSNHYQTLVVGHALSILTDRRIELLGAREPA
ncbi:putative quinol monooxygenase [Massilia sp. CMS3.1]|uniref:putative quinol monooxygenase n=1 Tax=Massilia sp. CMS3.1 TaxID=3373083 RepID=UPI003EE765B5